MCCGLLYYKDFLFPLITALAAFIGVLAAIIGGYLAFKTYWSNEKQKRFDEKQKRFEFFYKIKNQMLTDERIISIDDLLLKEDNIKAGDAGYESLKLKFDQIPMVDKYYLLVLYEQAGVALNSGLINEAVAHHMFGYRAILSFNSKLFWNNMPGEKEDDQYWGVYKAFVQRMKGIQTVNNQNPNDIKF